MIPPKSISLHGLHEPIPINLREQLRLSHNPSIRKENVQPAVLGHRIINDSRHGLLIASIKLPYVYVHARVEGFHLALVRC